MAVTSQPSSQPQESEPPPRSRFTSRGIPPLTYLGRIAQLPPVWAEGRSALEYKRLLRSAVYRGEGVIRGEGRPVLLIPGFMAGDSSLLVLRDWLARCGYDAQLAGIWLNIRYSEAVMAHLGRRLNSLHHASGSGVSVIGHSRGGLLGKVLANRHPKLVDRVVTLGSPLGDPYDVHPLTMAGVRLAHVVNILRYARRGGVETPFLADLARPAAAPLWSIYTVSDGIVHWEACLRPDAVCLPVAGSHTGLGMNREVYEILARVLAEARPRPPAAASRSRRGGA
ncbi:MAG: hypothetical protein M3024_10195 [Candidatus Dormibacteraeota bacterium]|nr:hypothetical protein [Candidatus Dormibacteraeota bacterium]